jgi:hypothetical protein
MSNFISVAGREDNSLATQVEQIVQSISDTMHPNTESIKAKYGQAVLLKVLDRLQEINEIRMMEKELPTLRGKDKQIIEEYLASIKDGNKTTSF